VSVEFWSALTAIGTVAATLIIAWYAWETRRLRAIAQDQLEGSVAPVLVLANHAPTDFPTVRVMDFNQGKPNFVFSIYNVGKGAALQVRLTAKGEPQKGTDRPGLSPHVRRPEGYNVCPIPAGTSVVVHIAQETLTGLGAPPKAIDLTGLRIELVYESASHRAYRSRLETPSMNFDDATLTEYAQLDARPASAREKT
jgi:hypothetical protein